MKKMSVVKLGLLGLMSITLSACMSDAQFNEKLKKAFKDDPNLLKEAVESHPAEFVTAVQNAVKGAQEDMAKKREDEEKKKFEESLDKPLVPVISDKEAIRGTKGAPLLLVEYSDFECPFCTRGYETVNALLKKYEGKIQFVYKHLPLSFHPQAMISAQYYEAIKMQNHEKAFKFHDAIFAEQEKLKNGEGFLKSVAKKLNVDMAKLAKDIDSKEVLNKIEADQEEAAKFGFQGTPGFLLNGVPVKGAYPAEHFIQIVEELQKRNKISL